MKEKFFIEEDIYRCSWKISVEKCGYLFPDVCAIFEVDSKNPLVFCYKPLGVNALKFIISELERIKGPKKIDVDRVVVYSRVDSKSNKEI